MPFVNTYTYYSIEILKEEVFQLVCQGKLHRQKPIYTLCQYIPAKEWPKVECELERQGYLLRDRIIDLLPKETWTED